MSSFLTLHEAIDSEDLGQVKALLAAGADPNTTIAGMPALNYAVSSSTEVVQALLEAGAKPNVPDNLHFTALMCAVNYERSPLEMIQALLAKGADVHVRNPNNGLTVLMLAVNAGVNPNIVKELLKADADPNIQMANGRTALIIAVVKNRHVDIVHALLEAGADPNVHHDVNPDPNAPEQDVARPDGMSALMYAVKYRNLAMFTELLFNGINIPPELLPLNSNIVPNEKKVPTCHTTVVSLENYVILKESAAEAELLAADGDQTEAVRLAALGDRAAAVAARLAVLTAGGDLHAVSVAANAAADVVFYNECFYQINGYFWLNVIPMSTSASSSSLPSPPSSSLLPPPTSSSSRGGGVRRFRAGRGARARGATRGRRRRKSKKRRDR